MKQVGVGYAPPISLPDRVANAFVSYAPYLEKMIRFDSLGNFYEFKPVPVVWGLAAAGAIFVLTYVSLRQWRSRPWITVGWLWYLGTLVPMIGLVAVGNIAMADRFTYFPGIGLLIVIFWSIPSPPQSRPLKIAAAGGADRDTPHFVPGHARVQIGYWKNSLARLGARRAGGARFGFRSGCARGRSSGGAKARAGTIPPSRIVEI